MKRARPSRKKERRKRAYQKPWLRPIKLHAGEVLGVGCKTTLSGGPTFTPCIVGCSGSGS